MNRYIGCIMCGVARALAKKEKCMEEAKLHGIPLVPGFEEQTHLWTEMIEAAEWFGKGMAHSSLKLDA